MIKHRSSWRTETKDAVNIGAKRVLSKLFGILVAEEKGLVLSYGVANGYNICDDSALHCDRLGQGFRVASCTIAGFERVIGFFRVRGRLGGIIGCVVAAGGASFLGQDEVCRAGIEEEVADLLEKHMLDIRQTYNS